ncbi:hypothetical protein RQM47_14055 [Rubrivirga sp. S365]|uniref:Transposase IS200-like domain-containing protein n=1 Tax=Rubrivirga litoralis TaxID=3075598 RepID=A0ABU3BV48_9BACT|nr:MULTISPECIES: hypothetical protein [unclassified Rubrivirga]MDT0633163.1 hypothetical protein [Rubrivirga sp. F394]MDT7857770.1 hypothetical protein [Rubrivirga sp. S365]
MVGPRPRSLGAFVGGFKASVTRRVRRECGAPNLAVWQRSYWDRVVRTEREVEAVRRYIHENPERWHDDRLHPAHPPRP